MSVPGTSLPLARRSPMSGKLLLVAVTVLWLMLWSLVGLTETAPLIHNPRVPLWHPIVIALIGTSVVAAWLIFALATRRFERVPLDPPRRWFMHHLRVVPLLVVAEVALVGGLREYAYTVMNAPYKYLSWQIFVPYEGAKFLLFYFLWLALMFGILTLAKWREDSERMLGVQKALAEAQLAQLQAQLRPHFLFNALNTVSSLMMTDTARADRVLAQLGDLLRASLAGKQDAVTLRDELKVLEKYTDIMQERFEGRARVRWDIAESALELRVPPMLLQPLLENAFKHGVERNTEPVDIAIRAVRIGDRLRVEIFNSGSSLKSNGAEGDACVGLRNCRERLRLLYGATAELRVDDAPSGGVLASVTLPCPAPAS
jgi:sensor histidine kinase YesM